MADGDLKAFCPRCGARCVEGEPEPDHEADCPFPPGFFPVVIFRAFGLGEAEGDEVVHETAQPEGEGA